MTDLNLERIGFWGLLIVYVVRDGIIPISRAYFPNVMKRHDRMTDREQDRIDKDQAFTQQMQLRSVEALEAIKQSMHITNERLTHIENNLRVKSRKK
jgi:hypothetical protein